jgi:DNA-binding NarL/FixJ family response regulator/chromosome segregation ATPase
MKVLFVTGDLRDGDFLEHEVKKVASNIQIEISPDVRDAASRLEPSASYDIVLIDALLSNGDCQTLINHIRQHHLHLPIIVIIGPSDEDPPVRLLAGGADDYVVKRPNYVSRMPALLHQTLDRYRARAQRRARTIRVLYAGDVENARRRLSSVPFIELEAAIVNEDGTVHRQAGTHPASLACDLVVLEDQALGVHVLKVLKEVTARWPDYPVVVLLAPGQEEMALQALRLGAADCIIRSGDYYERFLLSLDGLITRRDLLREKAALRSSEERLRMVIEFVPTCVTLLAADGTFLAMNWAGLSLVGAKHVDDIVGKNLFSLVGPPQEEHLREFVRRICSGERDSIRVKWAALDGTAREIELRAVPLRRDPNGTTAALAVMQDLSHTASGEEVKELQERCERLGRILKETETARRQAEEQKRTAEEALATAEVKVAEAEAKQEGERAHWESSLKELRQQLQSADERRTMLEEALMTAKSRSAEMADRHQAEISQLEKRAAEIERNAQAAREEKNTLEEILRELEGKHEEFVTSLRREKQEAETARDELAQRLAAAEEQRAASAGELATATARLADLGSQLESERVQWQTLREELEESRGNAEAQVAFMNDLLRAAEERYASLRESHNAESARWEERRQEFERQQQELLARRDTLEAEKQVADQHLSEVLARAEEEKARIASEREELERRRHSAEEQKKLAEEQANRLSAEFRAAEARLAESAAAFRGEREGWEAQRRDLELRRQSAEEQKKLAEEQVNRLSAEFRAAEARLAESAAVMKGERDAWDAERSAFEQSIGSAAGRIGALEEEIRKAETREQERSESHRAAETQWAQERTDLEGRLRSAEGEREALREVSRTIQQQLDQVVSSFDVERSHWLTARQQLESRCQGLEELESTRSQMLRTAEARLAEAAAQLQAERDAWEAARRDMEQKSLAAEARQQALQEALLAEQARRGELEAAEGAVKAELESVRSELKDLLLSGEERQASLELSLATYEKRVTELNERNATERARWEALRHELEQQIGAAERDKAGLEEALRSAHARCEDLAARVQAEKSKVQPALLEIEEKYRSVEKSRMALSAELQAARAEGDRLSEQLRIKSEEHHGVLRELEAQKGEVERLRQLQRETILRHQELIRKWSSDFEHALTSTVARCQQEEEERIQKMVAQQRAEKENQEEQLARVRSECQRLAEEAGARKQSLEADLEKAAARTRALVDSGLMAYALTTPEGRLLECNEAFAKILAHDSARSVIADVPDILKPVVEENGGPAGRLSQPDALVSVQCRTRRADTRPVVLQGYAGPLAGGKGDPPRLEWFFGDITDRHLLEEELRRSRRMESVGRLASEVAPSLNELLTSLESLCARLLTTEAGRAAGRDLADRLAKDTGRARRLAQQLWMFSQKQERRPEVFDLNSQLREQESILQRLTGEDIELRLSLDPEPQCVSMVKKEMDQALTTLIVIARDALPAGGTVMLQTSRVQIQEGDEMLGDGVLPGTYVQLAVSALGCGVRPASSTSTLEDIIRRNGGFSRLLVGQESETNIQIFLPHYE